MSTAVIWSKSKPDVEFQYGGRLGEFHGMYSHVLAIDLLSLSQSSLLVRPRPGELPGELCHPRATFHIAGCCHLVNSLS